MNLNRLLLINLENVSLSDKEHIYNKIEEELNIWIVFPPHDVNYITINPKRDPKVLFGINYIEDIITVKESIGYTTIKGKNILKRKNIINII